MKQLEALHYIKCKNSPQAYNEAFVQPDVAM